MGAYNNLIEWFKDCCLMYQEEPRLEVFEVLLKEYEKEITVRNINAFYGISKSIIHDDIVYPTAANQSNEIDWIYTDTDSIKQQLIKEIKEYETKTESNSTHAQDSAGASLSDTKG